MTKGRLFTINRDSKLMTTSGRPKFVDLLMKQWRHRPYAHYNICSRKSQECATTASLVDRRDIH
jgi:hypothetical protein